MSFLDKRKIWVLSEIKSGISEIDKPARQSGNIEGSGLIYISVACIFCGVW